MIICNTLVLLVVVVKVEDGSAMFSPTNTISITWSVEESRNL